MDKNKDVIIGILLIMNFVSAVLVAVCCNLKRS